MQRYIAVDLGAESGRLVVGTLDRERLELEVVHRFKNSQVRAMGHYHWDTFRLYGEMLEGLKACAKIVPAPVSLGVNTWGCDFGLLGPDGSLWGMPVCYRDPRTDGMMERYAARMPRENLYARTGIAFLPFNTLYQLHAMAAAKSPLLEATSDFMMMPDLFHYFFTGKKVCEYTLASTTQMLDAKTGQWDPEVLDAAGIPARIMPVVQLPGTRVGGILDAVREETGVRDLEIIAPACHDTAAAVVAVPAEDNQYAYISSGTWSLMGMEVNSPICTPKALHYNFTNEGGVEGTYRLLKNIMGLWLVQRCRADFDREYDYATLTQMAAEAKPFASMVNPADLRFYHPVSMTRAIAEFCRETGQPVPESPGAFVRCCLESLALDYRATAEQLAEIQDVPIKRIHIVGGGVQNKLLCQFTADATRLPVMAGPVEATALGNLLVQARAMGDVASLGKARAIVRSGTALDCYEPLDTAAWESAYDRFMVWKC